MLVQPYDVAPPPAAQGFVALTKRRNDFHCVQGNQFPFAYHGYHHPAPPIQDASMIDEPVIEKLPETFITTTPPFTVGHEKLRVPHVIVNEV